MLHKGLIQPYWTNIIYNNQSSLSWAGDENIDLVDPDIGVLFMFSAIIHKASQLSCVENNCVLKIIVDCGA